MLKNVKKVLIVTALAVSGLSIGQITVTENPETIKEWKRGPVFMAELTKYSPDNYSLSYRDSQYQQITEIKSFSFNKLETYYQFGNILKEQIKAKKNTELRIDVDGNSILIKTDKMMGVGYLSLFISSPNEPIGVMMVDKVGIKKLFDN
jgi:hypothetical protein